MTKGFLLCLNNSPSWPGIVQIFREILVDFDIGISTPTNIKQEPT